MSLHPGLICGLCFTLCFTLSVYLEPVLSRIGDRHLHRVGFMASVLGDGRKVFAQHFFLKADAYFHSGYYPSIFESAGARTGDKEPELHIQEESQNQSRLTKTLPKVSGTSAANASSNFASEVALNNPAAFGRRDTPLPVRSKPETNALDRAPKQVQSSGSVHPPDEDELNFLPEARDWISRFGRNFFPSQHSHLGGGTELSEILPWLEIAADLDPSKVEVYTVSAYWLRSRMGRVNEAQSFLRHGLSVNPHSHSILFEMGKNLDEGIKDPVRARNVWEVGLEKWRTHEATKPNPDLFGLQQILGALIRLDQREKRWSEGAKKLEMLKQVSPNPDKIEALRLEFEANAKLPF